jgi:protein-L-isoaspartate(D-aspartate) O-methyltransferase
MTKSFHNPVLDVGSGSGYLCACFAEMVDLNIVYIIRKTERLRFFVYKKKNKVGPTGEVVGIEHIPELVDSSVRNIAKSHSQWITNEQIKMIKGDGRMGYEQDGPYDCM